MPITVVVNGSAHLEKATMKLFWDQTLCLILSQKIYFSHVTVLVSEDVKADVQLLYKVNIEICFQQYFNDITAKFT